MGQLLPENSTLARRLRRAAQVHRVRPDVELSLIHI